MTHSIGKGETKIRTDLFGCARCGGAHIGLTFHELIHPIAAEEDVEAYTFTHWATCPTTKEPIVMRMILLGADSTRQA